MTVGEKIQIYRKSLQMSQDELGQKLNVSRQTISLWETGQTLPTIDNLILLKDVFGISIDELLSVAENKSEQETDINISCYLESYTFNLTLQEYIKIYRISNKKNWVFLIASIVAVVIWIVVLCFKTDDNFSDGTIFGVLIMLMSKYIGTVIRERKKCNKTLKTIYETVYRYEIYDEFFIAKKFVNSECTESSKVYYNKIEKVYDFGIYYIIVGNGQSFYIKKQELQENSILFAIVSGLPRRTVENNRSLLWSILSAVLNVFSVCSLFLGFVFLNIFKVTGEEILRYFWIFALLIPFSVATIVLGFYLKKTADKGRPNIIIGIVTTSILLILALFSVFGPLLAKNATECITRVEQSIDMDIPRYKEYNITTYANTSGTKRVSEFTFEAYKTESFEYEIRFGGKWLNSLPNNLVELTSNDYYVDNADYLFVYNLDTNELNTKPSESGTYNFINGYYDLDDNKMTIIEYRYKFEK